MIIILCIILVMFTPSAFSKAVETKNQCETNVDIAIVGAGASGTYAAWKLSDRYPEKSIHLYESSGRVGGRMYSVPVPGITDFKAELGAMRFIRQIHRLFYNATVELGLTVINFTTPASGETVYYLRGEQLTQNDLDNGRVPYGLSEDEKKYTGNTAEMIAWWNSQFIVSGEVNPEERVTTDGRLVRHLGSHNEWRKYGTSEALAFLADVAGVDFVINSNYNLAYAGATELQESNITYQYLTVKEGFDALPKQMVQHLLQANPVNNRLYLNQQLEEINSSTSQTQLKFRNKITQQISSICANDVILGMSQDSINKIHWPDAQDIDGLNAVFPIPATKVLLAYDYPWWRKAGNGNAFDSIRNTGNEVKYAVTDLPVRMVLDIGEDTSTGKSLLLIYNDMFVNLNFWRFPMEQGDHHPSAIEGEFTPTVEVIDLIHSQLAQIFNLSADENIPAPVTSLAQLWYDGTPCEGGWHIWKPGYKFSEVQEDIMKPLSDSNVYIIGEGYSMQQSWVEGAYERAEELLNKYFKH